MSPHIYAIFLKGSDVNLQKKSIKCHPKTLDTLCKGVYNIIMMMKSAPELQTPEFQIKEGGPLEKSISRLLARVSADEDKAVSSGQREGSLEGVGRGTWASEYGFALPRDEKIAFLLMEGSSRYDCARKLGISPTTVYRTVKSPQFITGFRRVTNEFSESAASQKSRISALASRAVDNIADVLYNSGNEDLKIKASFGTLDRAGHSVRQQATVHHTIHIDREAGDCIEAAFRELGLGDNLLLDIDPEESE